MNSLARQSYARNFGGELSKGAFLCFIDQDDFYYENMLESRTRQLEIDTDLLYTDSDIIDEKGTILLWGIHRNHGYGVPHPKKSIEDILFKDIVVMPGLMTIKKETFSRVHGFDEQLSGYEDDDLFLRIFEIGKIKYLPVSTLQCHLHQNNFSQSARMIKNRFTYYQKLIRQYTHQGTDIRKVQNISWRFLNFFWSRP